MLPHGSLKFSWNWNVSLLWGFISRAKVKHSVPLPGFKSESGRDWTLSRQLSLTDSLWLALIVHAEVKLCSLWDSEREAPDVGLWVRTGANWSVPVLSEPLPAAVNLPLPLVSARCCWPVRMRASVCPSDTLSQVSKSCPGPCHVGRPDNALV